MSIPGHLYESAAWAFDEQSYWSAIAASIAHRMPYRINQGCPTEIIVEIKDSSNIPGNGMTIRSLISERRGFNVNINIEAVNVWK